MSTPAAAAPLRFGRFELQVRERRLLADGEPTAVGGRGFDLLVALAERQNRLVSKRELMDLVWPGVVVEENNLAAQVSALRKVLGGDVIATIPGRGYRFVASVEAHGASAARAPAPRDPGHGASATARTNLPAELPALLGRAADMAALDALVERHRLVSIVGAGGMGKSLLAEHLLRARRGAYPHGVCWVELAEVASGAALPGAIAAALGVHGAHGDPLAALIAAAKPLTMLLALDNAEHQLAAVAQLCQALLDGAPGVRLVVTSQAPLGRTEERVLRIEPLAVPQAALRAAQAREYGAVALFAERAAAVDARFALTDANAAAVIELCRALDGVPLAIELAAARSAMLGLPRLLASMQDRLRLLTKNRDSAAPVRQRTLRATLQWSHGLLQPREQVVFRRLGVISGSASLTFIQQAVADRADGGELDEWGVLDALDALVDRSLVALLAPEGADEPRYRLLESSRAFALERLDDAGEREVVRRRHAQAMAASFDAAYDEYFSGRIGADAWLQRLESDLDNARDALAWARAAGEHRLELTIGATLLRALSPSLHEERMTLAEACADRVGHVADASLQQRVWLELSCAWADTQKARSREAAGHALRLARGLEHPRDGRFALYHALCRWAGAAAQCGELDAALAALAELQALEDRTWPPHRLLWGEEVAQIVARLRGDTAGALQRSRRLLALDRARGSRESIALGNLIDSELAAGDAHAAARSGAVHVAALEGTRDEYTLAYARLNLCAACLALDDCVQARQVMQTAWPQVVAFELQHYAAVYLALLAALEARPRAAALLLGCAQALYAEREEALETNEAAAGDRARERAQAALGEAAFARALAEGAALRDREVAEVAFAATDS